MYLPIKYALNMGEKPRGCLRSAGCHRFGSGLDGALARASQTMTVDAADAVAAGETGRLPAARNATLTKYLETYS
jgi:hypothetical protein